MPSTRVLKVTYHIALPIKHKIPIVAYLYGAVLEVGAMHYYLLLAA